MERGGFPALGPPFVWQRTVTLLQFLMLGTSLAVIQAMRRKIARLEDRARQGPSRPELIILLRHGESEANVEFQRYGDKGDPNVELTERGKKQALEVAQRIEKLVGGRRVMAFVSPYMRTRQTANIVLAHLARERVDIIMAREDPRLREREFSGTFQREKPDTSEAAAYNRFFWRPPGGESCADVYDRITSFIDTFWRCYIRNPDLKGSVALIVTHGLTMRVFAMRWLHWTPEVFNECWNPGNCGMVVFEKAGDAVRQHDWYDLTADSLQELRLDKDRAAALMHTRAMSDWEVHPEEHSKKGPYGAGPWPKSSTIPFLDWGVNHHWE